MSLRGVEPGRAVGFDVDTGYTASEAEQLTHMKAIIKV